MKHLHVHRQYPEQQQFIMALEWGKLAIGLT